MQTVQAAAEIELCVTVYRKHNCLMTSFNIAVSTLGGSFYLINQLTKLAAWRSDSVVGRSLHQRRCSASGPVSTAMGDRLRAGTPSRCVTSRLRQQISSVSKSCYYHIRQLRCIRPYLDTKTASTIATSIVHSKLDYCNSLCPSVRSPGCNRSRTFLHVLLSKLPNSVTPL